MLSAVLVLLPSVTTDSLVEYLAQLTQSQAFVLSFLPLTGGLFTYILASNWLGSIIPLALFEVPSPNHELAAPTYDLNPTACLGLLPTHAAMFCVQDYRVGSIRSLERVLAHRHSIIAHLNWIAIFTGFHSFGLFIHNDTLSALGRQGDFQRRRNTVQACSWAAWTVHHRCW